MTATHSSGYTLLRTASNNLFNIGLTNKDLEVNINTIPSPSQQLINIDTLPTMFEQWGSVLRDMSPRLTRKSSPEINLREATDTLPTMFDRWGFIFGDIGSSPILTRRCSQEINLREATDTLPTMFERWGSLLPQENNFREATD